MNHEPTEIANEASHGEPSGKPSKLQTNFSISTFVRYRRPKVMSPVIMTLGSRKTMKRGKESRRSRTRTKGRTRRFTKPRSSAIQRMFV
jgi:hypothetical protein